MSDVLDLLAESADMAFMQLVFFWWWCGRNDRGLFLFSVGAVGGLVCGRGRPALTGSTSTSSLFIINLMIFCNHSYFCRFNAMSVHGPPPLSLGSPNTHHAFLMLIDRKSVV